MYRLKLALFGVVVPLLALSLALSGCKKAEEKGDGDDGNVFSNSGGGGGSSTKTGKTKTPIPMGTGVIKGKVVLRGGVKPDIAKMNADLLVQINQKDDKNICLCADCGEQKEQQRYRLGTNGGVGNVFVWVSLPDRNSYFAFTAEDLAKLKLEEVKIGQPHCAFVPHASLAFPSYVNPNDTSKKLPTKQKTFVVNNADVSHNTKWDPLGKITGKNQTLPPKSDPLEVPLVPETQALQISCTIHPWMNGWIWSLDHPYAAITKSDSEVKEKAVKPDDPMFGTFEIHNVPVGVKLKLVAWHEEAGFLTPDKFYGGIDIIVEDGKPLMQPDIELEVPK